MSPRPRTTKPKAAPEVVWQGAEQLRQFLVPVDSLEPFPGNPRRGNIEAIREMLRDHGQLVPVTVDATHGSRIVKGHHVRLAAIEEGYTHVAVIAHAFEDDVAARRFLVGDNRSSELGHTDDADLAAQLRMLRELDALEGTGYDDGDVDDLFARVARQQRDDPLPPAPPAPARPPTPPLDDVAELVLLYSRAQRAELEKWIDVVKGETGAAGPSEAVFEGMRRAAQALNQS